jgi:hypothetical protein
MTGYRITATKQELRKYVPRIPLASSSTSLLDHVVVDHRRAVIGVVVQGRRPSGEGVDGGVGRSSGGGGALGGAALGGGGGTALGRRAAAGWNLKEDGGGLEGEPVRQCWSSFFSLRIVWL